MREELVCRAGGCWSRLAIEADFGSEVGIKGALEALMCVCLYRLQIVYQTGSDALQIELGGRH